MRRPKILAARTVVGMHVTPIRPDFERPPLVEQAISIVFQPIRGFRVVDYGLLWAELADEFPEVTTDAPLQAPVEEFESVRPTQVSLQFQVSPPLPRAMFRNPGNGELIQVQPDRFGFNWAKVEDQPYPRSEPLMARFRELFERFRAYIEKQGLGPIIFKQCELTNLNVIRVEEFGSSYADLAKALRVGPVDLGVPILEPEILERSRQLRILGPDRKPIGRLRMVMAPVVSNVDNSQAFRFELTARSSPNIQKLEDAIEFFGVARDAINGAFMASITDDMKIKWGEKHGE